MVSHIFYEKPCVSEKVLEYGSALPIKTKIITLTQEVLRRMRNTARREPIATRVEILNYFMVKLKNSEYPLEIRKEVLVSGLKGYYRMVLGEVEGVRRVNMAAKEGLRLREAKKLTAAANWYKPEMTGAESDDDKVLNELQKALGSGAGAGGRGG